MSDHSQFKYNKFFDWARGYYNFSLDYLESLPTIAQGQADDLKIDTGSMRVWLSRCTMADGEPFDNKVTIEHLKEGGFVIEDGVPRRTFGWQITATYQAE